MPMLQACLGVVVLLAIGYALSSSRGAINWRTIIAGVLLQLAIAACVLKLALVRDAFEFVARAVTRVISFADAGIVFLFGPKLADPSGPWGFVFAFKVLPVIVFFASLMTVLYHVGVMQRVVALAAWVLRKSLGITGAEALSASANIFVGQTEAPLTVKPYIANMTRSQLTTVMVGGFATIAGSVMAAYIGILGDAFGAIEVARANLAGPEAAAALTAGRELFAKHLLCASIMSAPAGIVMAKLVMPETQTPHPESVRALMSKERTTSNIVDAAATGATDGLRLALNVAAMLVAFVALLAMINWPLEAISDLASVKAWRESNGIPPLTLQTLLGFLLAPIGWLVGGGASWQEARSVASLMGTAIVATEFVAYLDLAAQIKAGTLSPRSAAIATYCLCGFANIASIGIQIGGLSALAPERRADLAALAPRAMLAGALACWMTGAVAGLFM
jgi:concentrative nucleoside transporter, CNT family